MGAPKSRFTAQFATLLQLQTCTCCLLQPTNPGSNSSKTSSSSQKQKKTFQGLNSNNTNNNSKKIQISSVQREKQLIDSGFIKPSEEEEKFICGFNLKCSSTNPGFDKKIVGQHVMKRRNVLDGKPRRPVKRPTTSSKIGENFYGSSLVYVKLLILWALVLLADYFLEFRFEYLWPFWLFLRSVYDSFKYQGLAFSVFFICIAITSDMICFLFIPVHWLFFAASTYVWVQYVWHTEKGFCVPTVFLWLLFVYIEASIRLKEFKANLDLKHLPFHLDLCRPFAAHCIGYPVVTLGFGFKSYVGFRMRLRRQKEVEKENDYYYEFLREALPPGVREEAFNFNPQPSPKACSEDRISENGGLIAGPPTPSSQPLTTSGSSGGGPSLSSSPLSNLDLLSSSTSNGSAASLVSLNGDAGGGGGPTSGSASNGGSLITGLANGKHHHNGDLNLLSASKLAALGASSPLSNGSLNNNAGGELDYMEKLRGDEPEYSEDSKAASSSSSNKKSVKSVPRDTSRKGRTSAGGGGGGSGSGSSTHLANSAIGGGRDNADVVGKMEADIKKLKVDLQLSRNKENDLRDQIVSFMTGERTLKSEISNLQVEKSLLESRINALMSTRAGEKATLSNLERKLADERKQKTEFQIKLETERKTKKEAASAEKTAQQNQTRSEIAKLEAEIKTLRSELERSRDRCEAAEREADYLRSYKELHGDPELLSNVLKNVQEKNHNLEAKLSEETKLKLDLFSELGKANREISIKEGHLMKKDKEINELSAKIAELLACMPSATSGGGSGGSSSRGPNVPVTSLASYVGNESLSLDLPATTELSFNSGKLTSGLGLNNLEDKLAGLYSPSSLGGTAYNPKANGNSLD